MEINETKKPGLMRFRVGCSGGGWGCCEHGKLYFRYHQGREMHYVCYLTECEGALLNRATSWLAWCQDTEQLARSVIFSGGGVGGGAVRPETDYSYLRSGEINCRQSYTSTPPLPRHVSCLITLLPSSCVTNRIVHSFLLHILHFFFPVRLLTAI
jgi:hypothetical protein